MPRRRWIDKKTAANYALLYRAQDDPLIHDASASDMVFAEVAAPNTNKVKTRHDLEDDLHISDGKTRVRDNEGEAANYGIYYDDTEYDYMQHLREIGQSSDAYFVEATITKGKGKNKGKGKMKLEDALKAVSLQDEQEGEKGKKDESIRLDQDILPSKTLQKQTYQNQQDVPDAIAGFKPDMDPRLREVLEALEDDSFVNDDDDSMFEELTKDHEEINEEDFETLEPVPELYDANRTNYVDNADEDAWESDASDATAKPDSQQSTASSLPCAVTNNSTAVQEPPVNPHAPPPSAMTSDWMTEYSKFKSEKSVGGPVRAPTVLTGTSFTSTGGRHKKRRGARTSTSSYSMTSSSLFRTSALRTLDDRFEKIEEEYNEDADLDDGDDMSMVSGMTGATGMSKFSTVSGVSNMNDTDMSQVRGDFDNILDEFIDGYQVHGKNRVRKGKKQTGMEQLDDIRKGLGPARLKPGLKA